MTKIILSTESGADIPTDLAQVYNFKIIPMHVIMEGTDYLDGSLPVEKIYDYYRRTKKIPSTTSTNTYEYMDFFSGIKRDNPDCVIIHIGYTSRASSSFQNAVLAVEDFEDIFLIDALNVSGGLAAVVLHAGRLLKDKPEIEPAELIAEIEAVVPKSRLSFIPGSLDFLRAGGRVSNAAYVSGSLLKIKPLIELIDGKLVATKKYRGHMNRVSVKLFQDYLKQYDIERHHLYFLYTPGLDENIQHRISEMAEENGFRDIRWIEAGAVISTHAGPGAFGIAGLEK